MPRGKKSAESSKEKKRLVANCSHHSQELAHVEINAVVEGEEAADHQDEDEEEQGQIHHSLASPVS